jgi:hypothetical protein
MEDEHSPYWSPESQTSTIDFLSAVARGVLFAAAIAMFLTLLGCDSTELDRLEAAAVHRDRFYRGCLPRKGDRVTAEWINGELICSRTTPTSRYGRTFPHVEVRIATIKDGL